MLKTKINAVVILILNIFIFIPQTINIVVNDGGPMDFGYLILPFLIFLNLFTIPSIVNFTKEYEDSNVVFWINQIGIIFCVFCFGYILR